MKKLKKFIPPTVRIHIVEARNTLLQTSGGNDGIEKAKIQLFDENIEKLDILNDNNL